MKKLTKMLVACLAVLPCAFAFTACGNQLSAEASVNTKGNYEAATKEDFEKFAKETKSFEKGARLTIKTTITMEEKTYDAVTNAIVTYEDGKISGMAIAVTTPEMEDATASESTIYFKDSKMYVRSVSGEDEYTYQTKMDAELMEEMYLDGYTGASLDEILEILSETAKVEKATSGKTTKWKITLGSEEEEMSAVYYFICRDGAIEGMEMTMDMTIFGVKTHGVATMEEYSGSIKYPKDLEDYSTELPKDVVSPLF